LKLTQSISEAASWIKEGHVICYPTEGVWGIGSLNEPELIKKIGKIKQRDLNKKFILLFDSLDSLGSKYEIEKKYLKRAKEYENSFTTIVFPTLDGDTLAARVPSFVILKQLLNEVGEEIISTSANISGQDVCRNVTEIKAHFGKEIYGVLDLELQGQTKPSTIIDVKENEVIR
jgi:L-threonylcarbamoyladenylate synthase